MVSKFNSIKGAALRIVGLFGAFAAIPLLAALSPPADKQGNTDHAVELPDNVPLSLPGSSRSYTRKQIDDFYAAPDWFPNDHAPMPAIASHGDRSRHVMACASCHLASGKGHPESANLAGLPASYQIRHLQEYASRAHFEASPMHENALGMNEAEMIAVSNWFAGLRPQKSSRVVEANMVPRSTIHPTLVMRQVSPGGGMEPINGRIIEVPANHDRVARRDPYTGFIAYVPRGSLAKGKILAAGTDRSMTCAACHGQRLEGTAEVPRLAGLSPDYVFRQLKAYKYGFRYGSQAPVMKPAIEQLSTEDLIALSAYVGSLDP